jgi:hypothetical protein
MQAYRHQCSVRQLLKYRKEWGVEKFRAYLIKHKFDKQTIADYVEQWELGNRGETNKWILKNTLSQQQGLDI